MLILPNKFQHTSYGRNTAYEFFCKRIVTDRNDIVWAGNSYFKAKIAKQQYSKLRFRKIKSTKKRYIHLKKSRKIIFFRSGNLHRFLSKLKFKRQDNKEFNMKLKLIGIKIKVEKDINKFISEDRRRPWDEVTTFVLNRYKQELNKL